MKQSVTSTHSRYRRARDFIAVLDAVFPDGQNTLTKKNANFHILSALLDEPTYLHKLLKPDKKDPAKQDAYQKIETLLMSPVLRAVQGDQLLAERYRSGAPPSC